jgi:hypothetical protein
MPTDRYTCIAYAYACISTDIHASIIIIPPRPYRLCAHCVVCVVCVRVSCMHTDDGTHVRTGAYRTNEIDDLHAYLPSSVPLLLLLL